MKLACMVNGQLIPLLKLFTMKLSCNKWSCNETPVYAMPIWETLDEVHTHPSLVEKHVFYIPRQLQHTVKFCMDVLLTFGKTAVKFPAL